MSQQWPIDEWIIGEGVESPGRWYVIHTQAPVYMCEVRDYDDPADRRPHPADGHDLGQGQYICNMVWLATGAPNMDEIAAEIAAVLDDYAERAERRLDRDRRNVDD